MDDDLQQLSYQCDLENEQRELEQIEYFNKQYEFYLFMEKENGA